MQIISKHWTDENLKSPAKPVNAPLIKKYTGVENYKDMRERVSKLAVDDSITGSSNFGHYLELLESDDSGWIEAINQRLQ